MTELKKSVKRLTNTRVKGLRLIIEIRPGDPETIVVKELRARKFLQVPIMKVYEMASRLEAEAKLKERKRKK